MISGRRVESRSSSNFGILWRTSSAARVIVEDRRGEFSWLDLLGGLIELGATVVAPSDELNDPRIGANRSKSAPKGN